VLELTGHLGFTSDFDLFNTRGGSIMVNWQLLWTYFGELAVRLVCYGELPLWDYYIAIYGKRNVHRVVESRRQASVLRNVSDFVLDTFNNLYRIELNYIYNYTKYIIINNMSIEY